MSLADIPIPVDDIDRLEKRTKRIAKFAMSFAIVAATACVAFFAATAANYFWVPSFELKEIFLLPGIVSEISVGPLSSLNNVSSLLPTLSTLLKIASTILMAFVAVCVVFGSELYRTLIALVVPTVILTITVTVMSQSAADNDGTGVMEMIDKGDVGQVSAWFEQKSFAPETSAYTLSQIRLIELQKNPSHTMVRGDKSDSRALLQTDVALLNDRLSKGEFKIPEKGLPALYSLEKYAFGQTKSTAARNYEAEAQSRTDTTRSVASAAMVFGWIGGSIGLVGSAFVLMLRKRVHRIRRLVTNDSDMSENEWEVFKAKIRTKV